MPYQTDPSCCLEPSTKILAWLSGIWARVASANAMAASWLSNEAFLLSFGRRGMGRGAWLRARVGVGAQVGDVGTLRDRAELVSAPKAVRLVGLVHRWSLSVRGEARHWE